MRLFSFFVVATVMTSSLYADEMSRIEKEIFGCYLGESKKELLDRINNHKLDYELDTEGDESIYFYSYFNKEDDILNQMVTLIRGHVDYISIEFKNPSDKHLHEIVKNIQNTWNVEPYTFNESPDQYIFLVDEPPVKIEVKRQMSLYPRELVIETIYSYYIDNPELIEFNRKILEN